VTPGELVSQLGAAAKEREKVMLALEKSINHSFRLMEIIEFLVAELEQRDGYSPAIHTCPECTVGTTPENKGQCLYHQAKKLLGE